ncbi:UDP-N-acetylmuramate dehydrogenase [Patescibacteria group bacterium]|jgi:UDP-N-acetylmuramate dehydrogenase|nr:UDP-N-acetylmuramate dehydrogenase [Patescibacteria group bacterium]
MTKLTDQQVADFKTAFPSAKENEPMILHTYLKIGGPARLYLDAGSAEELIAAVEAAKRLSIPYAVIGGGSNLLVSDTGYEGAVIHATDRTTKIEGASVTAAAGAFTGLVSKQLADANLVGFEWGTGVPGTIGGATYGNAGCFGGEMKDVVVSVDAYIPATGTRVTYSKEECRFGYRDSRFKHEPHVILNTTMMLQVGDGAEGKKKIEEIASKRKDSQPQGAFSAGCLFKNFDFTDESALEILKRQGDEIPENFLSAHRLPAGWLIEKLGLKGTTVGKAQVSPVHGNFLVNLGGARAQDVLALSSLVKMKVRDELGILLEDEVQYLGF